MSDLIDMCMENCTSVMQVGTSVLTVTMVMMATRFVPRVQRSHTGQHSQLETSSAAALILSTALASTLKTASIQVISVLVLFISIGWHMNSGTLGKFLLVQKYAK